MDTGKSGGKSYAIRELASLAGVTPRTIRSWTGRGLVAHPTGRSRAARYNDEHLLRVRVIQKLRAEGRPLFEVRRYLRDHSPEELAKLVGLLPQVAPPSPEPSLPPAPPAPPAPSASQPSASTLPQAPAPWFVHVMTSSLVLMVDSTAPELCRLAQHISDTFRPIAVALTKPK
jgi:DNA-binding transcriptional MerR regulator